MENQKECIKVKFSDDLCIFDDQYSYPEIDDQKKCNGPTGKVKGIQCPQAHAMRDFLIPIEEQPISIIGTIL